MGSPHPVTLKEIAARTGHAVATVSYALRGHAKIAPATRARIQEAADALGYRANPRISSLMALIRRSQHQPFGEKIAFVWVHTPRAVARRDAFLRAVLAGARGRAEQSGFALEEFYTNEAGMSPRRLEQILRARGITGVVLSPVTTNETVIEFDWDWSNFSAAVIGNVTWTPELHHAGHHHYLAMRTALVQLQRLGLRRPAAIIEPESNLRAKRAWEAAFLTHHPQRSRAPALLRIPDSPDRLDGLADWLADTGADSLIVSATGLLDAPGLRAACRRRRLRACTLYWTPEAGLPGIDQCYGRIAGHAVDLVITQLNANETGVPDLPSMMLFPGRWMPG